MRNLLPTTQISWTLAVGVLAGTKFVGTLSRWTPKMPEQPMGFFPVVSNLAF